MEFKLVQSKKKGKNDGDVAISKAMLKEIITLLNKVDCTCVWCDATQEYLKVRDIPQDLLDVLIMLDKLCEKLLYYVVQVFALCCPCD